MSDHIDNDQITMRARFPVGSPALVKKRGKRGAVEMNPQVAVFDFVRDQRGDWQFSMIEVTGQRPHSAPTSRPIRFAYSQREPLPDPLASMMVKRLMAIRLLGGLA